MTYNHKIHKQAFTCSVLTNTQSHQGVQNVSKLLIWGPVSHPTIESDIEHSMALQDSVNMLEDGVNLGWFQKITFSYGQLIML